MATQQANMSKRQGTAQPSGARRAAEGSGAPSASGTSVRDTTYGLISVIYHALQGAETYGQYIEDARNSGSPELVTFFEDCRRQENERAQRGKQLLASQLQDVDEEEDDDDDEDDDEDE